MFIRVNKIIEHTSKLYDPNGKFIGEITSHLELNDIRIQIKENKVDGYYIMWKDDYRIFIDKYGRLDEWPKGFYDLFDDQLDALIDWGEKGK